MMKDSFSRLLAVAVLCFPAALASADETTVAIAANFTDTARKLATVFEQTTPHTIRLSSGSTGKLYAQINHGAPFDVYLAADRQRPELVEAQGLGVADTRFSYARGKLVLWSPKGNVFEDGGDYLEGIGYQRLAMANPKTAPYGQAAQQVLEQVGLWQEVQGRLVRGESITQAFQFVATGNAEAGFVALSQVKAWRREQGTDGGSGSIWTIPQPLYDPIDQQAILLVKGKDNPAARAWMDFLQGEKAREIIAKDGYDVGLAD